MTPAYTETLVATRSRDGFLLEGVVIAPKATAVAAKLVWIHGVYAAFYAPPGLEVCRSLAEAGVTCVIGNTRGHNVGAWIRKADGRVVLAGGAWEVFADCVHDIAGWIEFVAVDQVVLAGHSLGARKVTLYQAREEDRRVMGLVLAVARHSRTRNRRADGEARGRPNRIRSRRRAAAARGWLGRERRQLHESVCARISR